MNLAADTLNWPTAAVLIAMLAVLAVVVWCVTR